MHINFLDTLLNQATTSRDNLIDMTMHAARRKEPHHVHSTIATLYPLEQQL
ncbi:hypothetical protein D3C81_1470470 [compost metagenome]